MDFHSVHKLQLLSYNQSAMREMGKLLSAAKDSDIQRTAAEYRKLLSKALTNPPKTGAIINVLEHAFGGFKNVLTQDEKKLFLSAVEEYRDERIPLSAVLYILRAWSVVHGNGYIIGQSFMDPFPKELILISDSGKGRSF